MPGTSHAFLHHPLAPQHATPSLQTKLQRTALASSIAANSTSPSACTHPPPSPCCFTTDATTRRTPFSFVADTDSVSVVIDSGANRIIVNDKSLLSDYQPCAIPVKGLNGSPVMSGGTATFPFPMCCDDGHFELFSFPEAVYCPTSPYNLFPPQLFSRHVRHALHRSHARHGGDDETFSFDWDDASGQRRTRTIRIAPNDLFILNSKEGYSSFFAVAASYFPP